MPCDDVEPEDWRSVLADLQAEAPSIHIRFVGSLRDYDRDMRGQLALHLHMLADEIEKGEHLDSERFCVTPRGVSRG